MIIFGWRTRWKPVAHGRFHCARCGTDRNGAVRNARRWFTLFFIPVFPYRDLGSYVSCSFCHTTYDPSVLCASMKAGDKVEVTA
jgi:zinc-ribbon family